MLVVWYRTESFLTSEHLQIPRRSMGGGQSVSPEWPFIGCFLLQGDLSSIMPPCKVMQLVVHMSALLYGWQLANTYRPRDYKRDLDGEFEPNLTNTVVFLLMATSHASSFFSNYEGHPIHEAHLYEQGVVLQLIGLHCGLDDAGH